MKHRVRAQPKTTSSRDRDLAPEEENRLTHLGQNRPKPSSNQLLNHQSIRRKKVFFLLSTARHTLQHIATPTPTPRNND